MVNRYSTLIQWFDYFQAFMERLGLWGGGTAFKSFDSFLASITKRGLGKWHSFQPGLRAVFLFFLSPSSKTRETRKWPRATLSRARALPSLNLKKKRDCSQSFFSPNDPHKNSPDWSPFLSLRISWEILMIILLILKTFSCNDVGILLRENWCWSRLVINGIKGSYHDDFDILVKV